MFSFNFFANSPEAQSSSASPSSIHKQPAYCRTSKLTGLEFMKKIRSVIFHGDLTDIAFLQKNFAIKLNSSFGLSEDGKPDDRIEKFSSDAIVGSPIQMQLIHNTSHEMQLKYAIAYIIFSRVPGKNSLNTEQNFIADCLQLTASELSSYFGGGGWVGVPTDGAPFAVYRDVGISKGKADSIIDLSFTFNVGDKIVTSVTMAQNLKQ